MAERFADLFEESLRTIEMAPGAIVTGTVVDIDNDWVIVHAGLKSEGVIDDRAIKALDASVATEVDDAYAFAESAPDPEPGELWNDVYAPDSGEQGTGNRS